MATSRELAMQCGEYSEEIVRLRRPQRVAWHRRPTAMSGGRVAEGELCWGLKRSELTARVSLCFLKAVRESRKLSAKDNAEYLTAEKLAPQKSIVDDPAIAHLLDHAMQVGDGEESGPSMENRQKPDLSAKCWGSAAI